MEKLVFDRSVTNALKIAAAICVAIFHHSYCVWCGTIEVFSFSYAATSKLASWGIAIFFFFSGYGLMESEQRKPLASFGCFMRRRILKIYVPVLLVPSYGYLYICQKLQEHLKHGNRWQDISAGAFPRSFGNGATPHYGLLEACCNCIWYSSFSRNFCTKTSRPRHGL